VVTTSRSNRGTLLAPACNSNPRLITPNIKIDRTVILRLLRENSSV
jgi:hypothetical protein